MVRLRASQLRTSPESTARQGAPEGVSDLDLAERVQGGDRWAEEAIFRRHIEYIFALSYRLLRDRTEAEDVAQDTFLAAFGQLRARRTPGAFRPWLAGIAVHYVHRRYRKRRLMALLGMQFASADGVLQGSSYGTLPTDLRTELGLLDTALSRVPEEERAAWMLRFVEGYELEEVAQLCGCSLSTAKRRIQRAREVVDSHVDIGEVKHG